MCLFVERNYTLSRCTAQRLKKQWHLQNKQSSAYSHITASISYKIISFHKSTKEHLLNRAQLTQVHTRVLYDAIFLHMFIYIYIWEIYASYNFFPSRLYWQAGGTSNHSVKLLYVSDKTEIYVTCRFEFPTFCWNWIVKAHMVNCGAYSRRPNLRKVSVIYF